MSEAEAAHVQCESAGIERWKLWGETRALEGLAVWCSESEPLDVRCEGEGRLRLTPGALATIAPGTSCVLGGRDARTELLVFRAGGPWLERAAQLARVALPTAFAGLGVAAANSDAGRAAARGLRELVRLASDCGSDAGLRRLRIQLELVAFAVGAPRAFAVEAARPRGIARRRRLHQAAAEFRDGPLEELSLAALAHRIGCSERQASRLFQDELGLPFREWAIALRIERACRLLARTSCPLIEVGAETGWSSLAHFNAAFRRRTGRTPGGFRASLSASGETAR